jgi:nucleoside-diphosphate-sugar epimerase/2-polyprenyl-3-methyl-5-hydroxy-6-metoxy-1,4-benzoquinol methylase
MKKLAIIGSCGYVGNICYSHLTSFDNIDVTCYDIAPVNIFPPHEQVKSSEISVQDIHKYDIILYVAGIHTQTCESTSYETVFDVNVNEPLRIVKCLKDNQLFIYASTAAVYSNTSGKVCSETEIIDVEHLTAYEKSMLEREIAILSENKNTIGLRMGSVIGISNNMRLDSLYSGVYKQVFLDPVITIWNVNAHRSILWYKDLINSISKIIAKTDEIRGSFIYNISSFNTTVYDVAMYASSVSTHRKNIIIDDSNNNIRGFKTDSSKFCDKFDYKMLGNIENVHADFISNKNMFIELINKQCCTICGKTLKSILNLGQQPLANDLKTIPQETCKYPLELYRCSNCTHTQIGYFVDKSTLFSNYIYESGTSMTSKRYFSDFAESYSNKINQTGRNVLEIACNDGSQLDEFRKRGWNTYGIDPAENLIQKAKSKKHIVICDFWGKMERPFKDVQFDLIVAQNVLAHVTTPIEFVKQCVDSMNDNTLLVIQTSQSNMYFNGEFDTVYHEHISFFTIKSMQYLATRCGCTLINVYKTHIHGTSYVFELQKGIRDVRLSLLGEEIQRGLYTESNYEKFKQSAILTKGLAISILSTYKNNGYTIIGYGAAAKGNVFLNYISDSYPGGILPDYIIDESPLKLNKYTPCTNIPIRSINVLNTLNNAKICVIVLAWNFLTEIEGKISVYVKKNNLLISLELLVFFPEIRVSKLKDNLTV